MTLALAIFITFCALALCAALAIDCRERDMEKDRAAARLAAFE